MNKFFVLSLLVLGCSADSYKSGYSYGSNGLAANYGAGYGSGLSYGSGYGSGYGLGSSVYGLGAGYGKSVYGLGSSNYNYQPVSYVQAAQPAYSYVQAAQPAAVSYVQAAQPAAVSYVQAAQPAVSYVHALPATNGLQLANTGYGAETYLTAHQGEARQEVVKAAVHQLGRTIEYKTVANQEHPIEAQIVEVEPSDVPLHLHFKTRSSTVTASQSHVAGQPQETQHTSSQDEPSRLVHEVQKPIVQEVREVITPYRQVTQEIQPVVENVHTVVTKSEGERQQYNNAVQYKATEVAKPLAAQVSYVQAAQPAAVSYVQAAQPAAVSYVQAAPVAHQTYSHAIAQPAAQSAQVFYVQPTAATTGYSTGYQSGYGQTGLNYAFAPAATTGYSGYAEKATTYVSKPTYNQASSYKFSSKPAAYTAGSQTSYGYKATQKY